MTHSSCPNGEGRAFTLVELLVSVALISLLSLLLVSMTNSTASTWRYTSGKIEQFRGASIGFEAVTRRLSQATLNTYWDYEYPGGNTTKAPERYVRESKLRFIAGRTETLVGKSPRRPGHCVFFQAPLGLVGDLKAEDQESQKAEREYGGLDNLLNTWGYYLEFGKDKRPVFLDNIQNPPPTRYRYRLMELAHPSNLLSVYSKTHKTDYKGLDWFTEPMNSTPTAPVHALSENVVAMVMWPRLTKRDETEINAVLTEDFSYDSTKSNANLKINSKNQLPPVVQVTLVAIDEVSASRLEKGSAPPKFDALIDTLFTQVKNYDADLSALETALVNERVNYRIFTSAVSLRSAKWSTN